MTAAHDDLDAFRELVARRLGLHFGEDRSDLLREALAHGMNEGAHADANAYFASLETTGRPLERLAEALTVGETYFFRQWDQFRALVEAVLPLRLKARAQERCLRMVSAGCASGEEPYSLAMLLQSRFPELDTWDVALQGVDINAASLAKALGGLYSEWSLRETPPDLRERFFKPMGKDFRLKAEVREAVTFEKRNLSEDNDDLWRPGCYDVIFCRNMLMYFAPQSAAALVRRMARSLAPGGFIFLGYAESLRGLAGGFHLCYSHDTFYYQVLPVAEPGQGPPPKAWPMAAGPPPIRPDTLPASIDWVGTIQRASERIASLAAGSTPSGPPPLIAPAPNIAPPIAPAAAPLERALDLTRHERFAEALGALTPGPMESPDALLLRAVLLLALGRYDGARAACQALLPSDAANAAAHYVLALCHEQAGECDAAAAEDRQAIGLDARFAMPWLHLGLLGRREGRLEQARQGLERALPLLGQEDELRVLYFSGGFGREGLIQLCRSNLGVLQAAS